MDFGSKFRIFWIYAPPGSPNRLKMMPRGVGSISTPADFLSENFEISLFRGHLVILSKKSTPEKSKPYINLEIYCITKKWHTHQQMRNVQHIRKSFTTIQNDFMRVELSHFPSENVEKTKNQGEAKSRVQLLFFKKKDLLFFSKQRPSILSTKYFL